MEQNEQINNEQYEANVDKDEMIRLKIIAILKAARDLTDDLYNASSQKYRTVICGVTDDISQAIRELKNMW